MSVMKFREPNRARWVGVRPGHDGIQAGAYGSAVNLETTLIYTVGAGKIWYVTEWFVNMHGAAGGACYFAIRDLGDFVWFNLMTHYFPVSYGVCGGNSFNPPLEVPAGYDLYIQNTVNSSYSYGHALGWIESV